MGTGIYDRQAMIWLWRDTKNWLNHTRPGDPYAKFGRGTAMDNGDKICAFVLLFCVLFAFIFSIWHVLR